jgi:hypothetical protein
LDSILYERKSSNFEIDELRLLGIHTAQVELAEEEQVLKFEPCFFWPDFPPFSLSDYPIRKDDEVYQDITGGEDPDESDSEWESSHYDGFDTDRLITCITMCLAMVSMMMIMMRMAICASPTLDLSISSAYMDSVSLLSLRI